MSDLSKALGYYADESNWSQCKETGWYCPLGPIDDAQRREEIAFHP